MRFGHFAITAAVVLGLSAPALAQQASSQVQTPPPASTIANTSGTNYGKWIASGFAGANFGAGGNDFDFLGFDGDDNGGASFTFGGQVGYLASGIVGGEFLAEFSPSAGNFDNVLFENKPTVNSYMFNAIVAGPFGTYHAFNPYVSGGIGWIGLRGRVFTDTNFIDTEHVSGQRFGWDLGAGVMAWGVSHFGVRGDIRYYRATSGSDDFVFDDLRSGGDNFSRVALSGIHFWKANGGVAFRW